jgi:hypothetical protein
VRLWLEPITAAVTGSRHVLGALSHNLKKQVFMLTFFIGRYALLRGRASLRCKIALHPASPERSPFVAIQTTFSFTHSTCILMLGCIPLILGQVRAFVHDVAAGGARWVMPSLPLQCGWRSWWTHPIVSLSPETLSSTK